MDFVMTSTTINNVTMMMVTVVDQPLNRSIFAWTVPANVNKITANASKSIILIYFLPDYTCKIDADCSGNGYCQASVCICNANYEYAVDCSIYGCKYLTNIHSLLTIMTSPCNIFLNILWTIRSTETNNRKHPLKI